MQYILDASALLCGKSLPGEHKYSTTPTVLAEISGKARRMLGYLPNLEIKKPLPAYIARIKKHAQRTGEDATLSNTDIEVLALALECEGILLTDDYSIQNIAREAGIEYRPIAQAGIKKVFFYRYRCTGCGKSFSVAHKTCPVCGAKVRREKIISFLRKKLSETQKYTTTFQAIYFLLMRHFAGVPRSVTFAVCVSWYQL